MFLLGNDEESNTMDKRYKTESSSPEEDRIIVSLPTKIKISNFI